MDTKTRIFELLDKLGMEQKAFAEAVGVKESTVSDWRRGKSNSYNRFLVKIAQVLGTTTADLLGEAQKSSPPSEEDRLLAGYDALSARNRERLEEYLDLLLSSQDRP